jgi:signal transduction histidine kinase
MRRLGRVRARWVIVALACAAAAALVFVSEESYQQSVAALDALGVNASMGHQRLHRSLLLGRAGIAALSALSLLAVLLTLHRSLARMGEHQQRQQAARAERDALERAVIERTAQLTDLARHLQTAREDERSRLARDLHDELGALLTSAKLDAARLRSRLTTRAPDALERLEHLVLTLNGVIAVKRRIIEDLRPSALSNLGLVATLEILAREFETTSGVAVHCAFVSVRLDPRAQLVAYRVVQEAITNISKYARARNVWLELASADRTVLLSVKDDGVGFDPGATGGSAHGLIGMRFRVEAEGGRLSVHSAPGQSTVIRASLPEGPTA